MGLLCEGHYPQMVFRNGKRMLWNPISRKPYVNRPEERVRLRTVEYLISEAGWSKNRISFELPVRLEHTTNKKRADLVCYNTNVEPVLLVECKAEQIATGQQVAEQIARYGSTIHTQWWLITNGVADHWFRIDSSQKPEYQRDVPPPFQSQGSNTNHAISYWQKRGFAGLHLPDQLSAWLREALNTYFGKPGTSSRYLDFKSTPFNYPLAHYYFITNVECAASYQTALTCSQSSDGTTYLTAVFNEGTQLKGALSIDLNMLFSSSSPTCSFFCENSTRQLTFPPDLLGTKDIKNHSTDFGTLPNALTEFFIQHC